MGMETVVYEHENAVTQKNVDYDQLTHRLSHWWCSTYKIYTQDTWYTGLRLICISQKMIGIKIGSHTQHLIFNSRSLVWEMTHRHPVFSHIKILHLIWDNIKRLLCMHKYACWLYFQLGNSGTWLKYHLKLHNLNGNTIKSFTCPSRVV